MPDSIPVKDYKLEDFKPGDQVFYMYRGRNGWWAHCEVVKVAQKMVKVRFVSPSWDLTQSWAYTWQLRPMADIPAEWHEGWLSNWQRILEDVRYRWSRKQRKQRRSLAAQQPNSGG
jgi:hypothetical protein